MAFVNEAIPEADKVKLDPKVFYNSATGNSIDSRWTIDRERNIFIICLGGGSRGMYYHYALSVNGEVVRFIAYALVTPINEDSKNGYHCEWWVFDFNIPVSLHSQQDEIMQIIAEAKAVEKNGSPYDSDDIKSVKTHFSKPQIDIGNF